MSEQLKPLPEAIKRKWATDYYQNIRFNQSLLQQQVPVQAMSQPPPNLHYSVPDLQRYYATPYYPQTPQQVNQGSVPQNVNIQQTGAVGGNSGSSSSQSGVQQQQQQVENYYPQQQQPPPVNNASRLYDENILSYVQGLSEEELRRELQMRGRFAHTLFKGDMQKELLEIMRYEKAYQSYYYPQSAVKRRKMSTGDGKDQNSKYEEVYNYTHHGGNYYGVDAQNQNVTNEFAGSFEFEEEDYEYVDPAPVGEANKNGCIQLIEGILEEQKERRYIGGKGNSKTPLPKQIIRLNRSHHLIRSMNPTELHSVAYLLSHNKINEKLRVLSKLGQTDFIHSSETDDGNDQTSWIACFDSLIVKFSSHSSGPYLKLRFDLLQKGNEAVIYSVDSHSFKTITKKGIKKREKKKTKDKEKKGRKARNSSRLTVPPPPPREK